MQSNDFASRILEADQEHYATEIWVSHKKISMSALTCSHHPYRLLCFKCEPASSDHIGSSTLVDGCYL